MSKKEIAIPFTLKSIQTVEFATIKELFDGTLSEIDLTVGAEFAVKSSEENEIRCSPEVCFLQKGKPFLKIKVACLFSVEKTTWRSYLSTDKKNITFPKGFTDHLLMITMGTLRGVLHAKTEGTPFNQLILPTINVTTLYNDNVTINIK